MNHWLRKGLALFVMAATLLSLPGAMSSASACTRGTAGEAQLKKECPRCFSTVTAGTTAQLARGSCSSKVSDARSATTPSTVQIERRVTRSAAPLGVTMSPATSTRSRAPVRRSTREAGSPPASYLSDYLRL